MIALHRKPHALHRKPHHALHRQAVALHRKGFSLVEIILAIAVVAVALVSLVSVFGGNARHAVQTRNRTAAIMLAQSLAEEVQGHPYGQPAPGPWPIAAPRKQSIEVWVEGNRQAMDFTQTISFANGSCIGKGAGEPWDRATITVSWEEYDPMAKGGKHEQKQLVAQSTVWRSGAIK